VHAVVEPRLLEVQKKLDEASLNLRKEVEPQITEIVTAAYKHTATGPGR
jgi:hypothetical protein